VVGGVSGGLSRGLFLRAFGYVSINMLVSLSAWNSVNSVEEPVEPPRRVSVVVPGWNEPSELLEISLSSLRNQTVAKAYPHLFDYIFVGCEGVDLSIPEKYGYRILCAPKGKLKARHLGIQHSAGEIIVAVDSDSYYGPNWLNLVLQPFHDPGVVGVAAPTWQGVLEPVAHGFSALFYSSKLSGRGSAFLKEAYYRAGGFNLAVDDLYEESGDTSILVLEEEVGFAERLKRLGRVVFVDGLTAGASTHTIT
jgi:cellulose synthase/poly-beta-1,6-N-acetylglucosamine synthase-like glycosyltransferase